MAVKFFATPTCPYCKPARELLESMGVEYEELNVAEDDAAGEELLKVSGQISLPVIEVDGQVIVGFNRGEMRRLLSK